MEGRGDAAPARTKIAVLRRRRGCWGIEVNYTVSLALSMRSHKTSGKFNFLQPKSQLPGKLQLGKEKVPCRAQAGRNSHSLLRPMQKETLDN